MQLLAKCNSYGAAALRFLLMFQTLPLLPSLLLRSSLGEAHASKKWELPGRRGCCGLYTEDWEDAEDGDYTLVKKYGDCTLWIERGRLGIVRSGIGRRERWGLRTDRRMRRILGGDGA